MRRESPLLDIFQKYFADLSIYRFTERLLDEGN
jgi:hypothetical protein